MHIRRTTYTVRGEHVSLPFIATLSDEPFDDAPPPPPKKRTPRAAVAAHDGQPYSFGVRQN
jgi:hypothetical protein